MTLLERYKAEYPNRRIKAVASFDNIENMTFDELQKVVSKGEPINPESATTYTINIKSYIEWLNANGISTKITPAEVSNLKFPLRSSDYVIFDDESLHQAWRRFFDSAEEVKGRFATDRVLITYAATILIFHGMTVQQLMELELSQVHDDGVIEGYEHIKLTPKDQAIIMNYKYLKVSPNGKALTGTKYIRSSMENVTEDFIYRQFARIKVADPNTKTVLGLKNIILAGQFNRIYEMEQKYGMIKWNCKLPDWFVNVLNENGELPHATFSKRRNQYEEYKWQRKGKESKMEVKPVPEPKPEPVNRVAELLERLDKAMEEIEYVKSELKKLNL